MSEFKGTCPMPAQRVIDEYFLEHRGKLLDIAAFLDRIDRGVDAASAGEDFRVRALHEGMRLVADGRPERARRLLEQLSDPTDEPINAAHTKSAAGAYEDGGDRGDQR